MKKFFLFVREAANPSSGRSSDTGVDLSTFAVPVDNLSYITAAEGSINITFTDTSLYEEQSLFEGEAVEKTNVTVSCNIGEEVALIENVLSFIGAASGGNVMRFDVTKGESTFNKAVVDSPEDISAVVRSKPVSIISGDLSTGDAATEYQGTVGEIFFGLDNLPELDFNHEELSGYSAGAEVTAWRNSGTLGETHSIASNAGTPAARDSASSTGFSTKSVQLAATDHFIIPNSFKAEEEYTIYAAYVPSVSSNGIEGLMFGDNVGETVGHMFNGPLVADGGVGKTKPIRDIFSMRHSGRTGSVANVSTTKPFPELQESSAIDTSGETLEIAVIRRDKNSNIYLHNRFGETIATIPALTAQQTRNNLTVDNMTDGALLVEQLGSSNSIVTLHSFKAHIARFGVIRKDIGSGAASQLAQDLFNLYNF